MKPYCVEHLGDHSGHVAVDAFEPGWAAMNKAISDATWAHKEALELATTRFPCRDAYGTTVIGFW